ncbi:aldehyde dehydrogenase family protein [Arthrobacter sulfonylureivorans]|uniref:Aldehyde dehydrogenase family protein n=1 Tax=Arthrobacter sulfonylureivorans TaxID=2486855 RepID=A0ABY3WJR3_9MICC|nr:aldehyde dehydrogenase family protein [Arthrobacter sulfonylureivorans]UNK47869.1 aldehyde dehydrogenase family protein [Arthrobacter sulfonylureivorans]
MLTTTIREDTQRFLNRPARILIGGEWVNGTGTGRFQSLDPATGQAIGEIVSGSDSDVNDAVVAARSAFESPAWRGITAARRAEMLWRLADLIDENRAQLAELETLDQGKPYLSALNGDVAGSAQTFRYMAGWATKLDGETFNIGGSGQFHAYTRVEPIGVVGQIIPWNFPIGMAAWKIAPALAAGCAVVLKPAELTSFSALRLGELALEAGIPPGVLNIVTGSGSVVGTALVEHNGIDKISFTGSTEVGKAIVRASAGNLKRVGLELGGKNASIVLDDADMDRAVEGILQSAFGNSGQVCTAPSNILVQERIKAEFDERLAGAISRLSVGPGMEPESKVGPLVSESHLQHVEGFIERSRAAGATIVTGGSRLPSKGYFLEPTLVSNVDPTMEIARSEVFGPVITSMPFDTIEAAASIANDTEYGLTAQLWTRNVSTAHKMAELVDVGSVWINGKSMDIALPFGGFKQSGWGQEKGRAGIEQYTKSKTVVVALDT